MLHAANSALAINNQDGRFDLVRCGLAIYGLSPLREIDATLNLRPAMKVRSEVSYVEPIEAGEGVSYGLSWAAQQKTRIATVPMGYADGFASRLQVTEGAKFLLVGSDILLLETLRWINSWSIAAKIT